MIPISICLLFFIQPVVSKLVFLQTACRHGDRAPAGPYPSYKHNDFWTNGLGRLTDQGVLQCYNNGKMYREYYSDLFSSTYDPEEMVVSSSSIDRTSTSGAAFASGFLRKLDYLSSLKSGKEKLTFVPYPVHDISLDIDYYLIGSAVICDRYKSSYERFVSSNQYKLFVAKNQDLINQVCEKAGYSMDSWSIHSVKQVYDTAVCDKANGVELPEWLEEDLLANITEMVGMAKKLALTDSDVRKFHVGGGAFVHLILENLRSFVNGSTKSKFNIIYAHDTTLLGFLANMEYGHLERNPNYSSCINIEIHQNESEYFVDVMYKRETDSMQMERLNVPDCPEDDSCPWNLFLASMETLELPNPSLACRPTDIVLQVTFTASHLIVSCVAISILLITLLTVAFSCGKNREATKLNSRSLYNMPYEPLKFMHDI